MRVLITVPSLAREFGGPAAKMPRLADRLRARGHDVALAGCALGPAVEGEIHLMPIGRFHATPIPSNLRPLRGAVGAADVVHIGGYRDPVGTVAAFAARRRGVPYLLEPLGMYRPWLRSIGLKRAFDFTVGRAVISGASAFVATSSRERDELVGSGVGTERVLVRANGIDVPSLLPLPPRGGLRIRLGIPPTAPLILSIGRLAAAKGLVNLAEAISKLPGVWGLIAGPDEGDGTLNALLAVRQRLALTERLVVLPGGLWGTDKAEALADADVFCLPSASESFSLAVAEAAAVGLPVVISDQCGVAEWLCPVGSRVVPHGDVEALTRAVEQVLGEPGAAAAAQVAAPAILEAFDWRRLAERQEEIYAMVIAGRIGVRSCP